MSPQIKERPILFSGAMITAILSGRKSQTRRVIKPQPSADTVRLDWYDADGAWREMFIADSIGNLYPKSWRVRCPYGQPGDRLWVRETWQIGWNGKPMYRADFATPHNCGGAGWKPSIHMRREHSRITLEVKAARVERVQDISEADARAEGIVDGGCLSCGNSEPCGCDNPRPDARDAFVWLWNSINEARGYGWAVNPFVWVLTFERVKEGA